MLKQVMEAHIHEPRGTPPSLDHLIAEALAELQPELCKLVPLAEHCDALRYLYVSLEEDRPVLIEKGGEWVTWTHAAEWLHLASGVLNVDVDAGRFDESDFMCRPAYEYNARHSLHQSLIARELVTFNMIWGSLESAAKLTKPPRVPKTLSMSPSEIDRILYALKLSGNVGCSLPLYREIMGAFVALLRDSSLKRAYLMNTSVASRPHIGLEGLGLDLVRRVRNSFAHGATRLEFDQDSILPPLALVIHLSSRLTLLAQQAMLLALVDEPRTIRVFHAMRPYVTWHGETLAAAARGLHSAEPDFDEDQMWLWPFLDPEVRREQEFDICGEWTSGGEVG